MAIVWCRKCTRGVSDTAITCPHCGAPGRGAQTQTQREIQVEGNMRMVAAFRDVNHDALANKINQWLFQNQFNAVDISVTVNSQGALSLYFHAFVIYERMKP